MRFSLPFFDTKPAPPPPAPPPRPHAGLDGESLFEAVVGEIHSSAAEIACISSALNRSVAVGAGEHLRGCRNYFPRSSGMELLVEKARVEMPPLRDAGLMLGMLLNNIQGAVKSAEAVIQDEERRAAMGSIRGGLIDCAESWRNLARQALHCVNYIEPHARWRLPGPYTDNAMMLARYLRMVAQGQWPCLTDTGEIIRPALPQRRRTPRFVLQKPCRLIVGGRVYDAVAADISMGGLGVTASPVLSLRQVLTVELQPRRSLAAYVVWAKTDRLGLQFQVPLAPNDPLLRG